MTDVDDNLVGKESPSFDEEESPLKEDGNGTGRRLTEEEQQFLRANDIKEEEVGNSHAPSGQQKQSNDSCGSSSSSSSDNDDISSEERKKSAAQKALELVEDNCSELFVDQFGTPYTAVKIGGHIETLPLKSSRFKNWLCKTYFESEGAAI